MRCLCAGRCFWRCSLRILNKYIYIYVLDAHICVCEYVLAMRYILFANVPVNDKSYIFRNGNSFAWNSVREHVTRTFPSLLIRLFRTAVGQSNFK